VRQAGRQGRDARAAEGQPEVLALAIRLHVLNAPAGVADHRDQILRGTGPHQPYPIFRLAQSVLARRAVGQSHYDHKPSIGLIGNRIGSERAPQSKRESG